MFICLLGNVVTYSIIDIYILIFITKNSFRPNIVSKFIFGKVLSVNFY